MIPVARSTPPTRLGALAAVLLLACSVASPAGASPETLSRSLTNILFGPLDMAPRGGPLRLEEGFGTAASYALAGPSAGSRCGCAVTQASVR